jgi:hypothetical protein
MILDLNLVGHRNFHFVEPLQGDVTHLLPSFTQSGLHLFHRLNLWPVIARKWVLNFVLKEEVYLALIL